MKNVKNVVFVFCVLVCSTCAVNAAIDYNLPLTPENSIGLWHMDNITDWHTDCDPLDADKQLDLSGGTIVAGATASLGNAIAFNGTDDGITSTNIWQGYTGFKAEGWVKFDDFTPGAVQFVVGAPNVFRVTGGEGGWFGITMWNSSGSAKSVWMTPTDLTGLNNQWFHFVAAFDDTTKLLSLEIAAPDLDVYVYKTSDLTGHSLQLKTRPICVGSNWGDQYFLVGAVDEIRITPEPATCLLFGLGALLLRKKRQ